MATSGVGSDAFAPLALLNKGASCVENGDTDAGVCRAVRDKRWPRAERGLKAVETSATNPPMKTARAAVAENCNLIF